MSEIMGYHRKEHLGRGCECNHINMPPGIDPIGIDVKNHHEMIIALCRQVKEIKDRIDNGGNTGSGGGATADEELRKELNTINLRIAALRTDVEDVENRLNSKRLIASINSDTSGITIDKSKLDVTTEKMTGQEIVDAINKGASDKIDSSRLEVDFGGGNSPVVNISNPGINIMVTCTEPETSQEMTAYTYKKGYDKYLVYLSYLTNCTLQYFGMHDMPNPVFKNCVINGATAVPSERTVIYCGGVYSLTYMYSNPTEMDAAGCTNEYFESYNGITFNRKTVAEPPLASGMECITSMHGIFKLGGRYYMATTQTRKNTGGTWETPSWYVYSSYSLSSWTQVTDSKIITAVLAFNDNARMVGEYLVLDSRYALKADGSQLAESNGWDFDKLVCIDDAYYTVKDNGDGTWLFGRSWDLKYWITLKMFGTQVKHVVANGNYILIFPEKDVIYIVNSKKSGVMATGIIHESDIFKNGDAFFTDSVVYRFGKNISSGNSVSKYVIYNIVSNNVSIEPLFPSNTILLSASASNPFTDEYVQVGSMTINGKAVYAYRKK